MAFDIDSPIIGGFDDPNLGNWDVANNLDTIGVAEFDLPTSQFIGDQLQFTAAAIPQLDFYELATKLCLNRADNTGGGPAFVYWVSPTFPDTPGAYYTGAVLFSQLTNIMCAAVVSP